ncbi:MAG: hypothetical protein KC444_02400 [Nitrosopumilus sp.]|nr:hypothetical protein [Nitrosopumilus sp.]
MRNGKEIKEHLDKIYLDLLSGNAKKDYKKILGLDESIRFVGRIKERKIIAFVRRDGAEPLLDDEMSNLAHYQISVKASMEEMFDDSLGKTNWMITSKELVKLITMFLDDGLLILSIDSKGDHDRVIKKIQSLNMQF